MIPSPPAAPAPPIVSISERSMRMTSQPLPPGKKLKKPLPLVVSRSFRRQCDRIPVNAYTDQRNYASAELRLTPINERTSSRRCPQHRPRHLRSTAPMLSGRDQPRLILASLPSSLLAPQPTRMYFWTYAHLLISEHQSTHRPDSPIAVWTGARSSMGQDGAGGPSPCVDCLWRSGGPRRRAGPYGEFH